MFIQPHAREVPRSTDTEYGTFDNRDARRRFVGVTVVGHPEWLLRQRTDCENLGLPRVLVVWRSDFMLLVFNKGRPSDIVFVIF